MAASPTAIVHAAGRTAPIVRDAAGRTAPIVRDAARRIDTIFDFASRVTKLTYTASGDLETIDFVPGTPDRRFLDHVFRRSRPEWRWSH